jgi:phospholipase/carboxylesterase
LPAAEVTMPNANDNASPTDAEISLEVRIVGARSGAELTVVLLHGFGASGSDLVPLSQVIAAPRTTQWVFPAAPLRLPGPGDGRAWWMLDLDRLERIAMGTAGDVVRDDEVPEGLAPARAVIDGLLGALREQGATRIVLGGFSQGAMLALDVALHATHPIAGLALMSTTRINAAAWRARFDRVRGLRVAMTHGTGDPLLPFATAASLRDELRAAGAEVDWVEFRGGHEIPPPAIAAVERLLA